MKQGKICTKCNEYKNNSDYYSNTKTKDKLASFCKICSYNAMRKSLMKVYYEEDKIKRRKEVQKKYREENKEKIKAKIRETKYSLSNDDYIQMLIKQNYSCLICNKHQADCKTGLHIDHCHSTKIIRGLLCGNCNTALGLLKDNIIILENTIKYLKQYK